ncbi:P-loop containing nucleoside triphosphate hydrolase protein [Athelia psychrophila]|uniref:P-loop containing nucleoside triphosphate hydrolase protein n=1 Tax=Athelia psychrophila TaxID=1759441 RepID=A0A166VTW7_9AGAM|nr:P-loop containing nucleoside triphosphate hydrolase protein [Fibularhizoctonia sp. CBS 109695]
MAEKQASQNLDVVLDNRPIPPRVDKDQPVDEERVQPPKDEQSFPAVSFLSLFRLHTPFEIALNLMALVAAAAAGAAQPLMSLMFGNLSQAFIEFGADIAQGQDVTAAGERFKQLAAQDALYIFVIGIGMGLATWLFMAVWTYTGEVNAKRLRERYLQAVLRQEIAYFDNIGAGEVATRIQSDTHLVQQGTSEKVGMAVEQLSSFVTGFVVAYVRSWRLALALTAILPCIALTGTVMTILMSRWTQAALGFIAEGGTLAEEVISSVRTAQAFGSQQILAKLYDTKNARATRIDLRTAVVNGVGLGCFYFIVYAAYGLAFYFGTTLILDGKATVGIVVNVFMSILTGSYALVLLGPEQQAISQARGAAAKIYATIDRVPAIDSSSPAGAKPAGAVQGHIVLEDVVFRYPSRPDVPILKGLTLEFAAGKTTALVGASGSGKSTLIGLVERFYDPLAGAVRLDGANMKDLNVGWLRAQIGLVAQEPALFATTIRGNVAHGLIGSRFEGEAEGERERRIQEACVTANAHEFIEKLPRGYDTLVGERGFLLSGGQKQRIAIARAIVSDPRILLLDEATSALDTQSEGVVQNALDKAAAGRTTITIAHRLSTIRDADRIYVMGDGAVLEHGTHNALLANAGGPYSKLVAAQKLREARDAHAPVPPEAEAVQEGTPLARQISGASVGRSEKGKEGSIDMDKENEENATLIPHGAKEYSIAYLFARMGRINSENWLLYLVGMLGAVAVGCVYPAFGIVYARAVSTFVLSPSDPGARHELRVQGDRNALWFFVIALLSTGAMAVQTFFFARSAALLTSKLRFLSFKAILRQDIEYFDQEQYSTGALTSGLSANTQKVNGLAGVTLGSIIQSVSTIVVGMIIGLAYAPKLAAVAIATLPFVVGSGYVRLRVVVLKDQVNKAAHEASAQMACEAVGAIRTVAALTRERDCCEIYSRSLDAPLRTAARASVRSTLAYAVSQALSFFVIALVFWYGSRLVAAQEYSSNEFFVCLMSVVFSAIQAGSIFGFVPDMSAAKGGASEIVALLDSMPTIDAESMRGAIPQNVVGEVRLQDVHFQYPTRPSVKVLRGLNITVKPGTYVALVGASGCGKSTVVQLLERFYDPVAGRVLMDGIPIDDLNVQEYRKHIALVSQEPTLYAGTIAFNVLLGATKPVEDVTQAELEEACRNANILDFIKSLPDGFDTNVGGKGAQLSGGQKQRVAIARALLRNPKVLLLDEATSALDSQSEKVVQEALDRAAKGRTTIAIAHRLSTIQNADCIYFLQDGRVLECGTHDQLTAARGAYWEYTQQQQLSKTD